MKRLLALTAAISLVPTPASAHCPLCTGGAGAAAVIAGMIGVRYGAIAVFMGGFSIALALWLGHKLHKYAPQLPRQLVAALLYLSTILPIYPFLRGDYSSIYVSLGGGYGSPLNRTYLINLFYVGAALGTLIVLFAPKLSSFVTQRRGQTIRYQGLAITFALLIVAALIMQYLPR